MCKQSSISLALAFASTWGVIWTFFDSFSKARSVFVSAVFWEIIVIIRVWKGSPPTLTSLGNVRVDFSVFRIVVAHVCVNV